MKKAIFMMGLPASGKSTWRKQNLASLNCVDADELKEGLPCYNPKKPELCHKQSKVLYEKMFNKNLLSDDSFVIDGTGTSTEKMIYRIKQAQNFGFETELVYVKTSLKNSIERNSKRDRVVPEHIIREKCNLISISFEIVSSYIDTIKVINN